DVPTGQTLSELILTTYAGGSVGYHTFPFIDTGPNANPALHNFALAHHARIYADPTTTVSILAGRNSSTDRGEFVFTVSGYLSRRPWVRPPRPLEARPSSRPDETPIHPYPEEPPMPRKIVSPLALTAALILAAVAGLLIAAPAGAAPGPLF